MARLSGTDLVADKEVAMLVLQQAGDGGIGAVKVTVSGSPRMVEQLHVEKYQGTLVIAAAIAKSEGPV